MFVFPNKLHRLRVLCIIWLKVPETSRNYFNNRIDLGILSQNPSSAKTTQGEAFSLPRLPHLKLLLVFSGNKCTIQRPGFAATHLGTVSNVLCKNKRPLREQS